jgi:hypothetical protein
MVSNAATVDLTNLAAEFAGSGENAAQEIDRFLIDAGNKIMANMQQIVHVKTGRLKASIVMQVSPGRVEIGPVGVPYASYVEFGTGMYGEFPTAGWTIRPKKPGGVLVFEVDGKKVFAREVHHKGSHPYPYVRPAVKQYLASIGAGAAKAEVTMTVGPNA